MIKLMFPAFVCVKEFLDKDSEQYPNMTREYFKILKDEMDNMRKLDPTGRNVSNSGGWQSNDGIESNPIFVKAYRTIKRVVANELVPALGLEKNSFNVTMHNSWGNMNFNGNFNKPHLHNGCFYSGVMYIRADGDEGNLVFVDTNHKVAGVFPPNPIMKESEIYSPRTGDLYLFPSGLMHMVEPNLTNKTRYSISFNLEVNGGKRRETIQNEHLEYEVNDKGDCF
tara:strand:+ start:3882 stop:4556 length:675 start_codon:yes stop_codon:yes gene_type:complete